MSERPAPWNLSEEERIPLSYYEERAKNRPKRTPWEKFQDNPGPAIIVVFTVTVVVVRIILELRM